MDKQIPVFFDSVVVSSPIETISAAGTNAARLKVRVFTKYANRNGSYITDAVAEQLIKSATSGNVPVVGFFDPQTQSWASHSGPALANSYGYIEDFVGWEPFEDTDGVTRDYAVFSIVLFTDYFEEARKIVGQNQSMELDPASIDGSWTMIENEEYFVYTTAKMLGFCVIGEHEPCFSVSAFFSKNNIDYSAQLEKLYTILYERVVKNKEGGRQTMENENKLVETPMEETEGAQAPDQFQSQQEVVEPAAEPAVAETAAEFTEETEQATEPESNEFESNKPAETEPVAAEPAAVESASNTEFDALQQQFNELQEKYNAAQSTIDELNAKIDGFANDIASLRSQNEALQSSVSTYEQQALNAENARKNSLVEKYEKSMEAEEIEPIKAKLNDFSYDELESKLAIAFANKFMASGEPKKVPLPQTPEQSEFAAFMQKYRK